MHNHTMETIMIKKDQTTYWLNNTMLRWINPMGTIIYITKRWNNTGADFWGYLDDYGNEVRTILV